MDAQNRDSAGLWVKDLTRLAFKLCNLVSKTLPWSHAITYNRRETCNHKLYRKRETRIVES